MNQLFKGSHLLLKKLAVTNQFSEVLLEFIESSGISVSKVGLENVFFEEVEGFLRVLQEVTSGLKSLEISFSSLEDYPDSVFETAISAVTGTGCKTLSFRHTNISDSCVELLVDIIRTDQLNTLDLTFSQFSAGGFQTIMNALATNSSLTTLSIGGNPNYDSDAYAEGINQIFENENLALKKLALTDIILVAYSSLRSILLGIKYNHQLCSLDLSRTGMKVEGMKIFTTILAEQTSLEELNLSGNKLTEESVELLQTALSFNASVKKLILRRCFLPKRDEPCFAQQTTDEDNTPPEVTQSYRVLMNFISENDSITYLDLKDNKLGDEHLLLLSKALKLNRTITSINLGTNPFQEKGVRHLSSAIIGNKFLKTIDVKGVNIDNTAGTSILWALRWNTSLEEIHFGNSPSAELRTMIKDEISKSEEEKTTRTQPVVAEKSQLNSIVKLIVENNSNSNPRFLHMVPDEDKREKVVARLVKATVKWAQKYQSCYVNQMITDEGAIVLGTTVWIPPQYKVEAPLMTFLKQSMKVLVDVGVKSVSRIKAVVKGVEDFTEEHAPATCWKLIYFEVSEEYNDLDIIWTSMFKEVLELADSAAHPIFTYITQPDTIRILELLHFEVVHQATVDGTLDVWGMIRQPQPKEEEQ